MYSTPGLIPAKFLTLIAHLSVCVLLLWNSRESARACLPENCTRNTFEAQHTELVVNLSVALGMIGFELLAFLTGITMFHSTSALFSVGCHASASIILCYLVFDNWQCGWYWWVFTICSVLPTLTDLYVLSDVFINKKY